MNKKAPSKKKIRDGGLIPPSSLFDTIEISADVDFTDSHSLKRALVK